MFHAGGHKGATRGRSSGFSRHYPGLLSHHDWKQPLRCGILFCSISSILFVIGVILTWLGSRRVHDVFGESVPITGPILLAVGGLMLLLAFRQFYIARQRQIAAKKLMAPDNGGGGVGSSAVLQASSTTLQTQNLVSSEQHATAAFSEAAVITPSSTAEDLEPIPDSHKIFPSDYLFSHQRTASGRLRKDVDTGSTASAGISNFPKQTAVMMLRTLELQETI
ncbi:hypothetical protein ElyMa_004507000 [Elysia marginata]|uniref:Uncharacterized protein n=1 Tax=Elysia marginata TaxID=1093978 RepID=A0AAV4HLR6_9GAST|nr:hypothetical protein ElyMa_004507000 [Elysia marginata]